MQERKVREERTPRIFILVHSNLSYIQFVKATLAWLCTISKVLQSILTLPKYAKIPQKTLESHKNHTSTARTLLQTWKATTHTHKAWERSNLAYHKPLSPSFKPSQKLQELIQDQSLTTATPMITKERVCTSFQNQIVL